MARKEKRRAKSPVESMSKIKERILLSKRNTKMDNLSGPCSPNEECLVIDNGRDDITDMGEWILAYKPMLLSLCRKYSWADEIEELFQVVCVSVVENFHKYDPHQRDAKRSTYLYVCAENAIKQYCRDMHAKKRTFNYSAVMEYYGVSALTQRDEDGVIALMVDSGEDSLMEAENYDFWMDAIEKLPPNQRDAIRLVIKGYTQMEIAAILGKCQGSVSGYINQARATLNVLRKAVA